MKKSGLNGSADLLATAIRNSQKEVVEEAVKRLASLMEVNKKEILKASKEDTVKTFEKMGRDLRRELRKELKIDLHKYMGMYTRGH